MSHDLPPLTALRSFEAAARHLSFTRAAEELHVTQTAVSHQVRLLEAHLGTPLFRRLSRRVTLTVAGRAWASELGDVFARLRDATARLRAAGTPTDRPLVSVSVLPSLATRWMVPRLGRFLDAHPGIDVRISPTRHLADFTSEAIDLGIRYGGGRYPGLVVEKLADDELVVAAAPSLLARQRLAEPADLRRHKLLHDDSPDEWRRWLAAHGARDVDASRGHVFNDASMLLEAAVRGQGVALARRSLAMDELGAGRLVLPLPRVRPMRTGLAYYVAGPRENLARPAVAAFVRWLRAEAAGLRAKG